MYSLPVISVLLTLIFFILRIIHLVRIRGNRPILKTPRKGVEKFQILVVLGSGGHSTEMLRLLTPFKDKARKVEFTFVVADTDHTSIPRIPSILGEAFPVSFRVTYMKRIRNVGDSLFIALLRIPSTFFSSLALLFSTKPDLILVNGPGTCLPLVFASFILQVSYLSPPVVTVFAESFCRTRSLSVTGKILYPFVDLFVIQWPPTDEMKRKYPKAKYLGVLL